MKIPSERVSYISAVENGQRADLKLSRLSLFASALDSSAPDLLLMATDIEVKASA